MRDQLEDLCLKDENYEYNLNRYCRYCGTKANTWCDCFTCITCDDNGIACDCLVRSPIKGVFDDDDPYFVAARKAYLASKKP